MCQQSIGTSEFFFAIRLQSIIRSWIDFILLLSISSFVYENDAKQGQLSARKVRQILRKRLGFTQGLYWNMGDISKKRGRFSKKRRRFSKERRRIPTMTKH